MSVRFHRTAYVMLGVAGLLGTSFGVAVSPPSANAAVANQNLVADTATFVSPGGTPLAEVSPALDSRKWIENVTRPKITGTQKVGETLTVDPGTWSLSGGLTFSYSWFRFNPSTREYEWISGAGNTYVLTEQDMAKYVYVGVSASAPGYVSGSRQSSDPIPVAPNRPAWGVKVWANRHEGMYVGWFNKDDRVYVSAIGGVQVGAVAVTKGLGPDCQGLTTLPTLDADGWAIDDDTGCLNASAQGAQVDDSLGKLVGRFGNGKWFSIGEVSVITADQDGPLQLAVNDNNSADNTGYFEATISPLVLHNGE